MSATLADNSIPLHDWVVELFNKVFFQPDDALSAKTFEDHIGEDLLVRINHDHFPYEVWKPAITAARADKFFTEQSNKEVQVWNAPDNSGAGCVALLSHFSGKSKKDGTETKQSTLATVNVQVRDGKRMMVELTEVVKTF